MKIALTVDPELPVPPREYGGVERIVALLADGLVARGHEITLFAHPDSRSPGDFVPWPGAASRSRKDTAKNAWTLARHVIGGKFDLVHSHSRIAYLTPILPLAIPKLMTYHRWVTRSTVRAGVALSRGTLAFTTVGGWMREHVQDSGTWFVVPNGVPDTFQPVYEVAPDAPLVFLGRIEEIKGPHLAIQIAKATSSRLVIAGTVPADHASWFEGHIAPHIDGKQITYVGPVDDRQKNSLLGNAKALLMPILWDEPFGLVMAEALACGTPVLGLARGAVPEVVEDGVTGFVRDSVEALADTVAKVGSISRTACRDRMQRLYTADAIVNGYIKVYEQILSLRSAPRAA